MGGKREGNAGGSGKWEGWGGKGKGMVEGIVREMWGDSKEWKRGKIGK